MIVEPGRPPVTRHELVEWYHGLGALEIMGVHAATTLVLGALVLGLLPGYGTHALRTSRRSPIISCCIGLPGAAVLVGLFTTGVVISGTGLGVFFGMPLVVVTVTFLPAWTALGYVAFGSAIARRLGFDALWVWVVVGALLSGVAAADPLLLVVATALAAALGVGSGARGLLGGGGFRHREERVIPPADKV